MLNLVSLSTQSLASCVNYFVWNCLTCFSNTKIGSVTSFSILFNFQGPVRLSLDADDLIILPQKRFFVKLFFSRLLNVLNLDASKFLGADRNFSASIGSFQRLRAETSEVILLSQRLALTYSTTFKGVWQAFFQSFLRFFSHLYTGASFLLQTSGFFGQVCPVSSYLYSNKGAAVQKDAQQPLWFSSFLPASSAAGSARPPLPASAACRSGLWAWDPAHCNRYLPGSSAPAAVPQWR